VRRGRARGDRHGGGLGSVREASDCLRRSERAGPRRRQPPPSWRQCSRGTCRGQAVSSSTTSSVAALDRCRRSRFDSAPSIVDTSITPRARSFAEGHGIDALAAERLRVTLPPDDGSAPAARAAAVATARGGGPRWRTSSRGRASRALPRPRAPDRRGARANRGARHRRRSGRPRGARPRVRGHRERARGEIHALAGGLQDPVTAAAPRGPVRASRPSTRGCGAKTGLSVDAEVLARLAEDHPIVAKVLEHRTLSKLISTYVSGLLPLVDPATADSTRRSTRPSPPPASVVERAESAEHPDPDRRGGASAPRSSLLRERSCSAPTTRRSSSASRT
jgi:hypothetical protein